MQQISIPSVGSYPLDSVIHGDCIEVMRCMPAASVDFILTDPPYLQNFRDRQGRGLRNDTDSGWLRPAFCEAYRVLKPGRFCLCFYGWPKVDRFMDAWRAAGFRPCGHLAFCKRYASNRRFLRYEHEPAYLLVKGDALLPERPISDVQELRYSGNQLHPTEKHAASLEPVIAAFSGPGETVLDPFCGSGSTLVAARNLGRHFVGIELDPEYHAITSRRIQAATDALRGAA